MKLVIGLIAALCSIVLAVEPATQPAALAGESHQIENVAQRLLLRPRDASSKDGAPIVLYPHQDWKCMTWRFEPAGDDGREIRLVNYFTHKTICPDGTTHGSAVTQHTLSKSGDNRSEGWRFVPVSEGVYRVEHVATGLTLTVKSDDSITIEKYTGDATQQFKLLGKPAKFTG
jgi:hypothetical protein